MQQDKKYTTSMVLHLKIEDKKTQEPFKIKLLNTRPMAGNGTKNKEKSRQMGWTMGDNGTKLPLTTTKLLFKSKPTIQGTSTQPT